MLTFSDWFPLATVGLTFTILGSLKLWGLNGASWAVLTNRWFNGSVALSPSCEPTLHRSDRKSRELPPHRSLEGKGNRHFVAGQSGGSARLVS